MKNRLESLGIIGILLISSLILIISIGLESCTATTLYVGGDVGGDYTRIQAAIDHASAGDTIFVYKGTYRENLIIDKSIDLIGENRSTTIIDGMGIGSTILIKEDNVNITGLTITNSGYNAVNSGIELFKVRNCTISNNDIISNINSGIYLNRSSYNKIKGNNISSNQIGILFFLSSGNNEITENVLNSNLESGIELYRSPNSIITKNYFVDDGIFIKGDQLSDYNTHTISPDNKVNSKPLYYYKGCTGIHLDGNSTEIGQLILINCTDIEVKNLEINNSDIGIQIAYSKNIVLSNNRLSSNHFFGMLIHASSHNFVDYNFVFNNGRGILVLSSYDINITNNIAMSNRISGIALQESYENQVVDNEASSNRRHGIYLWASDNNTISSNTLLDSHWGIFLSSSSGNRVFNNEYIDNDVKGYDTTKENYWDIETDSMELDIRPFLWILLAVFIWMILMGLIRYSDYRDNMKRKPPPEG